MQKDQSKKIKLEEWDKKLRSVEALKIVTEVFLKDAHVDCDPDDYLQKVGRVLHPKYIINNEDVSNMTESESKLLRDAVMSLAVENDVSLIQSVEEQYRGLAMKIRRELIKEHDCETYSEKMLVDMIVSSYIRNLTASRVLMEALTKGQTTDILNKFISVSSQETDRANRHYVTALATLKQMKSPNLSVNVKTNNAFFAQNQQINTVDENKVTPNKNSDEIIDQQ